MRTPVQRVAAIHDLSGFGRTSLTVVIPILSTMGIQVCPMPTAVLSTHTTEFTDFSFLDLSSEMSLFLEHWKKLNLSFDAIYSGFLGSAGQIEIVKNTIAQCLNKDGFVVVDPVLGDNGKLDPTITQDIVEGMQNLVKYAYCITPNYSEALWLLGEKYTENCSMELMQEYLQRLAQMGPELVVVTSVPLAKRKTDTSVIAYHSKHKKFWQVDCPYIPAFYPGTGDAFASVLTGSLLQGDNLPFAISRAVQFVTIGIRSTFGHNYPNRDGILLERVLDSLRAPVTASAYELLEY